MWRVAVLIGSRQAAGASELASATLPTSDRAAIGLAVRRFGSEVQAYCRRADAEAWHYALAAGVTGVRQLDSVTGLDYDVMLVGSGGAEPYGDLLLAQLAAEKQGAMVCEVLDVVCGPHGLTVTRDLGRGSREVLALDRPAVLGIAADAAQLLYVSRYRRQVAEAAVQVSHAAPLSDPLAALSSPWEPLRPRVRLGGVEARTSGAASTRRQALFGVSATSPQGDDRSHVIVADAVTCAQHLLRFLSHHGMIPAAVAPSAPAVRIGETVDSHPPPTAAVPGEPLQRGPRPLAGVTGGVQRQPRPLSRLEHSRAPRPPGAPAPRRQRGPRAIEAPRQDKGEQ
jgi:hypothetical protein